ncbi:MAG: hypothetical protein ACRED0_05435, partial [Gammaproteobacteria bacterium]
PRVPDALDLTLAKRLAALDLVKENPYFALFLQGYGSKTQDALDSMLAWKLASIDLIQDVPYYSNLPGVRELEMIQANQSTLEAYERLKHSAYIRFTGAIRDVWLIATILLLTCLGFWVRNLNRHLGCFIIAGCLIVILYLLLISVLLAFIPRYQIPYQLLLCILLGSILGQFADVLQLHKLGCHPSKVDLQPRSIPSAKQR